MALRRSVGGVRPQNTCFRSSDLLAFVHKEKVPMFLLETEGVE